MTPASATGSLGPLEYLRAHDFKKLVLCNDSASGLHAVIAIHSTALGPSNGGVRMRTYRSDSEAILDALRLARSMTYKWAVAGEDRGGGKAVIIGNPRKDKTETLMRAFGRHVNDLGGEYWAGVDVGIDLADMEVIHRETDYVATLPEHAGGAGDITFATAYGVLQAMHASAERTWGTPSLKGRSVALQGLGACGSQLLGLMDDEGARVTVADLDPGKVKAASERHPVSVADPMRIHAEPADIYAPCALGGVLNPDTVPEIRARVIVGSANNILADDQIGRELERRGILCAVDYVSNAGGAIFDAHRFHKGGFVRSRAMGSLDGIFDRTHEVFERAIQEGVPPHQAANKIAEERIEAMRRLRST